MAASDEALMWAEVEDIGHLLHELDDAAFDTPSLCEGWAVRDVLGHMGLGHTTPMGKMLLVIARYGFNVPAASRHESATLFAGKPASEIRRFWDEVMVAGHPKKGIAKLLPPSGGFVDHLVHNQDIRRPTGHLRQVPEDRLSRALELVTTEASPFFNPKRRVAGLRLEATDVEWSKGTGPLVRGPGEALIMAASGRTVALPELSGDGVDTLRARMPAA